MGAVECDHSECESLLLVVLGQRAGSGRSSESSAGAHKSLACLKALLSGLVPSAEGIILLNSSGSAFLQIKC